LDKLNYNLLDSKQTQGKRQSFGRIKDEGRRTKSSIPIGAGALRTSIRETGRRGEGEKRRRGDWETLRLGEEETGRRGENVKGQKLATFTPLDLLIYPTG